MAILLPDRIDVATFGAFLRDARERRGLTLQQIARETRIPWRHLDALEHGNLDVMPAGVYRRAEVRAYADAVGLDRSLALTQFEHALESSKVATGHRSRDTGARQPTADVVDGARRNRRGRRRHDVRGVVCEEAIDRSLPSHGLPFPPRRHPLLTPAVSPIPRAPRQSPIQRAVPTAVDAPVVVPTNTAPVAAAALTITSDPPGARVMVDGIGRGATPLTVDNLTARSIRIRVIKDGYVSQERDVRIGGRPASVARDAGRRTLTHARATSTPHTVRPVACDLTRRLPPGRGGHPAPSGQRTRARPDDGRRGRGVAGPARARGRGGAVSGDCGPEDRARIGGRGCRRRLRLLHGAPVGSGRPRAAVSSPRTCSRGCSI